MRRVAIHELVPGMVTAEDVYTYSGQLILPKGLELTDKSITRLELYTILSVRISDSNETENLPDSTSEENVSEEDKWPFSKIIKNSPEFKEFKQNFEKTLVRFESSINDIIKQGAPINLPAMLEETVSVFKSNVGSTQFFNMMHNMRQYDDTTFAHSLNVALICNVFSGWLGLSHDDTEMATICGLFHDIGKLAIPEEIIKKPAELTEEEFDVIKTHTLHGYNFLKNHDVSNHIKNAALMHHERCDGSGYPFALKDSKIDVFAKIVSIADVYDAMTAARVYRGPLCPFTVIEIFEHEGLQKYDSKYILTFLENIVLTYMHNRVELSDGTVGDIVFINKAYLSRPMIKSGNKFIDLSVMHDLSIVKIL